MKRLGLSLIIFIFFSSCKQKTSIATESIFYQDTVENINEFSLMVNEGMNKMNLKDSTTQCYIQLVKISNTILSDPRIEKSFDPFFIAFYKNYLLKITKRLNCNVSIGLGYYCREYDLMIGGGMPNKNSKIFIRN